MSDVDDGGRRDHSKILLRSEGWSTDRAGLLAALAGGDAAVRSEAAYILGVEGDPESADALDSALGDEEARVRVEAALALWRLGRRDAALAVLLAELDGAFFDDAPLRAAAALATMSDVRGYQRVLAALHADAAAERLEGLIALRAFVPLDGGTLASGHQIDVRVATEPLRSDPEAVIANEAVLVLARLEGE